MQVIANQLDKNQLSDLISGLSSITKTHGGRYIVYCHRLHSVAPFTAFIAIFSATHCPCLYSETKLATAHVRAPGLADTT